MFEVTGQILIDRDWYLKDRYPVVTNIIVEGGDIVKISWMLLYEFEYDQTLEIGDEIILAGQSFIFVEKGIGDYIIAIYIRDWSSRIGAKLYHWFKPLTLIKYRVIMTCRIWRLASVTEGMIPAWKNIHLVNKIYSWITHMKGKIYPDRL